MTTKKIARKTRQHVLRPILAGTCVYCGAKVFDGPPVTCCVRGLLGYMAAVVEHAAEVAK